MAKKNRGRSAGSALHLQGVGCVNREEERIAVRTALQFELRYSLGLVSEEEVQQAVIEAIRLHRELKRRAGQ